jgi:hypothetical protein
MISNLPARGIPAQQARASARLAGGRPGCPRSAGSQLHAASPSPRCRPSRRQRRPPLTNASRRRRGGRRPATAQPRAARRRQPKMGRPPAPRGERAAENSVSRLLQRGLHLPDQQALAAGRERVVDLAVGQDHLGHVLGDVLGGRVVDVLQQQVLGDGAVAQLPVIGGVEAPDVLVVLLPGGRPAGQGVGGRGEGESRLSGAPEAEAGKSLSAAPLRTCASRRCQSRLKDCLWQSANTAAATRGSLTTTLRWAARAIPLSQRVRGAGRSAQSAHLYCIFSWRISAGSTQDS